MSAQEKTEKHAAGVLLAIDVRNATTRFGLFGEGDAEPFATWTVSTREPLTADEAKLELAAFFSMLDAERRGGERQCAQNLRPDDAIIASVVPGLTCAWEDAARFFTGRRALVVGPGLKTGLKMRYNDPSNIGADRIANLVAAKAQAAGGVVAIDMGTTTNMEVVDEDGAFCGGVIAPGLEVSARAVADAAARLVPVAAKAPKAIIGKNTADAMQSGIVMGEVARIDGLLEAIWRELGYTTNVIISGANAALIRALSAHEMTLDDAMTLKGLKLIHDHNRK